MSRASVSDKWLVDGSVRAVRKEVLAFLEEHNMDVVEDREGVIEATQGSQLRTRLLGGWFVNARHLPKKVRISIKETEEAVAVRARLEETLGFGIMDPLLKQKYESFFEEWLDELQKAIS